MPRWGLDPRSGSVPTGPKTGKARRPLGEKAVNSTWIGNIVSPSMFVTPDSQILGRCVVFGMLYGPFQTLQKATGLHLVLIFGNYPEFRKQHHICYNESENPTKPPPAISPSSKLDNVRKRA